MINKTTFKFIFLIALAQSSFNLSAQSKNELSFNEIFLNPPTDLFNKPPQIKGWADDSHYYEIRTENGTETPYLVDAVTGKATVTEIKKVNVASVDVVDKDIIYTSADGTETKMTSDTLEEKNPTLSPDGKYIAFTRKNDLFSIAIADKKETRHTNDGTDLIYNGYASWVYYEEILGRPSRYKAFWWSPDSKHIAYMRFDDTKIPLFPIYSEKGQHGYLENTRYPKAGDRNPEVKMGIVNTGETNTTWTDFNPADDQYFGTPFWTEDGNALWMQWMNRDQNNLIIYAIDPQTGKKKTVYEEKQKTWIDWFDDMQFLSGGKGFILRSDKSGMGHFYLFNSNGTLRKQLTSGNWRVADLKYIDEKKQEIYFTARKEATTRFDLYKVSFKGGEPKRLTFGNFDHNINLSPNAGYFITTYSNLNTPPKMAVVDKNGKQIREIYNEKGSGFDNYQLTKTTLKTYKTRDGLTLPYTIILPLGFDETKKYPVLVSIYGGPDAGTVYDHWRNPLGPTTWLAKEGIIQVAIDNRSAGHLGKTGLNYIYRQVGIHEIEDYMDAGKYLKTLSYVNGDKFAMTGGSFGGYMTLMALTYGADIYTHGIANYSVTDWSLYDSHYTERFMDTPQDNADGYKKTSVLTYADKYKGMLKIVHGTMDDNVHMQNSIQLVNKFEDLNKHFEFMVYPGERHGWRGKKARHSSMEAMRFYYRYLLEKPIPKELSEYWK